MCKKRNNIIFTEIKEKIDAAEVVSFDIFDTLILRNYAQPTDLFRHLEVCLNLPGFAEKRIEAEKQARKAITDKNIEEVTLDQIYINLEAKYKKYKKDEITLEKQACKVNPEIKEVYDYCLSQKKRIIITSDMYLPLNVITDIINKAGYSCYEKIFLSSETKHQKAKKTAYDDLITYTNVPAEKILHIGDNSFGDMQMAVASGLSAHLYTPSWKKKNRNKNKNYFETLDAYSDNSVVPSILKGLITIHEINNPEEKYWENFGYKYTGIIALSYMRWLKKELDKQGIKKAYFMLRDGYIFKQVFDTLYPSFETYEIFGSRSLFMLSGMREYKDIKIHITGIHREGLTYRRCWERLNINDNDLFDAFTKIFPNLDETISGDKNLELVDSFFEEHFERLKAAGEKQRKILIEYFKSIGIFDGKNAIVDLGWKASMLKGMLGICSLEGKTADLYGYYFGTHQFDDNGLKVFCFSIAKNKPDIYPYKVLFTSSYAVNLLELMFSAPHASILGIKNEGGKFLPVYQCVSEEENVRLSISQSINKGVSLFLKDYLVAEGPFTLPLDVVSSIVSLEYFEKNVSQYDEQEISKIYYFPGVGDDTKGFPIVHANKAGYYYTIQPTKEIAKKAIALVTPWAGDLSAERECMLRIKKACEDLGINCLFVDSFGWILDPISQQRTNVVVNPNNLLFAITLHYESHKSIDTFYYHAVWNPPEIPMNLSYYTDYVTNNYMMNDDFLIYDKGGMKNHLKSVLINCPREINNASELVGSFPQSALLDPSLNNPTLFYCGMNWEVVVQGDLAGSRHQGLFKLLDETGKVKFFGPDIVKQWGNKRPWGGYKSYIGSIPFDGFSILKEINDCGICLVLSSDIHRRAGAVTNRAYEACAAGAVIISDDNEYMLDYFKDAALFITFNKKEPVDTFNQIMEKYYWILSHKEEALALARKAQDIFRKKFALDIQLKKIIDNHASRILQIQKDLYAKNTDKTVLVTYLVDTLDIEEAQKRVKKIIENIKKQYYKNIILGIACDESILNEITVFSNKYYENTTVLSFELYDKKGSRCITRGIATRKLHKEIQHDYFIIANYWENWFSDHVTTLVREIENTDNCGSYSGSLILGVDGYSRTCNFGIYTQLDFFNMARGWMQQKAGEYLFKSCVDDFVPEFIFDNIDGLEHILYANYITAKQHKKISFSRRMTYSINEIEIDETDKVLPNIMQVRLIQDAVRFDIAEILTASNKTLYQPTSKTEVIDYVMDIPIKRFIKLRLKRKFPKLFKVYKFIRKKIH